MKDKQKGIFSHKTPSKLVAWFAFCFALPLSEMPIPGGGSSEDSAAMGAFRFCGGASPLALVS